MLEFETDTRLRNAMRAAHETRAQTVREGLSWLFGKREARR